jgi:hypothetical protein
LAFLLGAGGFAALIQWSDEVSAEVSPRGWPATDDLGLLGAIPTPSLEGQYKSHARGRQDAQFKGEFRRSAICSISETIDIEWSIFLGVLRKSGVFSLPKKTVSDGEAVVRQ